MARLRQQYPNNYLTSGNISTEFENLVRYLNVGELGNKTLGELLTVLFDSDGVFQGPIEMRLDSTLGLQYRVGTYAGAETGWVTLSDIASLRGTPGADLGTIGAPILYSRQDTTAIANQTIVDYAHVSTDELLVYKNGLLKREGSGHDYTKSHTAGTGGAGAAAGLRGDGRGQYESTGEPLGAGDSAESGAIRRFAPHGGIGMATTSERKCLTRCWSLRSFRSKTSVLLATHEEAPEVASRTETLGT